MVYMFLLLFQGRLKALSTGGAEGILYRVIKLKNPIVSKGRESGNMFSQKNFEF